ncbi:MAG: efflux RND transporter periplasmic adaptor subunit [Acidobacteria bacterium]|nr:efflux RND transporter periplasmic adaptor subunit [Acidobacteriota bacterium]
MRTKALIFVLLSMLALQLGCGEKRTDSNAPGGKPAQVHVIAIQHESIPAFFAAPGTVQARNRIALSSQINGFVREMRVRVGDSVKPDQILAVLDARDAESQKSLAQAAIVEAQAALSEAQQGYKAAGERRSAAQSVMQLAAQTFQRYEKLFESRSVSPQEMDEVRTRRDAAAAELASSESMAAAAQERIKQVEARIAQAKAQANRADVMVGWTQIKAPAAGRIVERSVDRGTAIFPGTPLMVIESTARPQVLADLPAQHAHQLQIGKAVRLRGSDTGQMFEGRIAEIVPLSNPATHSTQFKVDVSADFSMPNGHFIKVEVPVGSRDAVLVPRHAIRQTGQLMGLFVLDSDSIARFRLIKAVPYDAERLEVLSGIESGERILVELNHTIVDGTPVEIKL